MNKMRFVTVGLVLLVCSTAGAHDLAESRGTHPMSAEVARQLLATAGARGYEIEESLGEFLVRAPGSREVIRTIDRGNGTLRGKRQLPRTPSPERTPYIGLDAQAVAPERPR